MSVFSNSKETSSAASGYSVYKNYEVPGRDSGDGINFMYTCKICKRLGKKRKNGSVVEIGASLKVTSNLRTHLETKGHEAEHEEMKHFTNFRTPRVNPWIINSPDPGSPLVSDQPFATVNVNPTSASGRSPSEPCTPRNGQLRVKPALCVDLFRTGKNTSTSRQSSPNTSVFSMGIYHKYDADSATQKDRFVYCLYQWLPKWEF